MGTFSRVRPAPPLAGVRVLDLSDGRGEMCGRYLADLGADVVLAEPPGGAASRRREPLHQGRSLYFAARNAGKRGVTLDALPGLLGAADILVETGSADLDPAALLARHPALVVVSITDFGRTGPYRDWQGTEWVHLALGGVLSRSGIPGLGPLMPPGSPATESAAMQAAWAALLAYGNRLDTGRGDHVDVSIFEATVQVLDPGFGIGGSARGGRRPSDLPRGRPDARHLYPIFPCADGHVRLCVLSPRQWRGLRAWLGEPAEFAAPELESLGVRYAAAPRLHPLVTALFATRTRAELIEEGQRLGVPVAAVLTPAEVLSSVHFAARGAFTDAEVAPGLVGRIPSGYAELDGVRAGFRHRAPEAGEHTAEVLAAWSRPADPVAPDRPGPSGEPDEAPASGPPVASGTSGPLVASGGFTGAAGERRRPLLGLRVLDLGVIVLGAELGRLFADQGAEVIKVENAAFPDGSRQAPPGQDMTASFAWGHRNKLGFGVDLRSPDGVEIFKRLVAESDVVLSNFKPGTMESLGLGYEELAKVNPRVVVADSSALGATGPWSRRMGYGPLVRASTALTALWRYPEAEDGFSDAITIYPDHSAARVAAVAVLAALLDRRRTGRGRAVSVSQAETILTQMSDLFLHESLAPGTLAPVGNSGPGDAPRGVYACAGDDEWCAVTVRDDRDWSRLLDVIGRQDLRTGDLAHAPGRVARRDAVDAAVAGWTSARTSGEVMTLLQDAGVPAGAMRRVHELPEDPQLVARGLFRPFDQPQIPGGLLAENAPALSLGLADPGSAPAPMPGQHTREICRRVLGMTDAEVDRLLAAGTLEAHPGP
ncbi:CaiB/BaiF CoA transferase family protein [Sphaerisporangium corydalis]|uniref:CaiB/BaiF CoA transferase family protein n=1 Tax=Sphaerisporangium corydalis TaxID=1441875 RepID=A0ABV9E9G2_9ACTN|nr:CoA transferase [Sphaerisporangium corydalis]